MKSLPRHRSVAVWVAVRWSVLACLAGVCRELALGIVRGGDAPAINGAVQRRGSQQGSRESVQLHIAVPMIVRRRAGGTDRVHKVVDRAEQQESPCKPTQRTEPSKELGQFRVHPENGHTQQDPATKWHQAA